MSTPSLPALSPSVVDRIRAISQEGIDLLRSRVTAVSDPFWKGLKALGTELWLDTGDIDGASKLWAAELSALTTNNTLLNAEVQKGIYDDLIAQTAKALSGLDPERRVMEVAFVLNARHGLRLAQRFGGKVSVELHTGVSHDVEAAVAYGRRFFDICPQHFIVKVPLTPAGLIATRQLRRDGIPVNFTLGFSARHNYLAAAFAEPSYVNVFLGRLNAYFADNKLGDGKLVGEKATLASQRLVRQLSRGHKSPTLQIAASLRGAGQVASLAGLDVYTMPPKVAEAARKELPSTWKASTEEEYPVALSPGVDPAGVRWETLWDLSSGMTALAERLLKAPPTTPEALVAQAEACGARDLFPRLGTADLDLIAREGKVPKHETWRARIQSGELAIDTLLNIAGLLSFTADQRDLDDRIRRLVG